MTAMTVDQALENLAARFDSPDADDPIVTGITRDEFDSIAAELRRLRAEGAKATFTDLSVHPAGISPISSSSMDKAVKAGLIASWVVENGNLTRIATVREIINAALPHLPVYREFHPDGKPFCRRSWNEGRKEGIRAANECREQVGVTAELRAENERLRRELDSLRDLCGAAYQAAGASDWPVEWLDNLSDAANGDPLRHDVARLLPFLPDGPSVHGFDPSPARRTVTLEWPDGRCLAYVLDTERYTDTPEVIAAMAESGQSPRAVALEGR